MAKRKDKKVRGAVSSTGKVGVRFKEGTAQDSSAIKKPIRTTRLANQKKTIPGNIGERQSGETVSDFKLRRERFRNRNK
jgi:hypothetical protein